MQGIELLCTLGPASFSKTVVSRLKDVGATLFRINLSHTPENAVEPTVRQLLEWTDVPICLDTEGAQIRTGTLKGGFIEVAEDDQLLCTSEQIVGDKSRFYLHPGYVLGGIQIGDLVHLDFDAVICQVTGKPDEKTLAMRVIHGGRVGQNKAVSVDRQIRLNPLTQKDLAAVQVGVRLGVTHYALSFAHRGEDVDAIRELVGPKAKVISKIECVSGLLHLDDICRKSDAILIDRGDLSREIPIEMIPVMQRRIVAQSKSLGTVVYVATNLLESMTKAPSPTRAEVNDIYSALESGVDGLVLASETAIGNYPVQSAAMVMKLVHVYESQTGGGRISGEIGEQFLVSLRRQSSPPDRVDPKTGPANAPHVMALSDWACSLCEILTNNLLDPVSSFMDSVTLASVINHGRLPGGAEWKLPVFLALDPQVGSQIRPGSSVVLRNEAGEKSYELSIEEVFRMPAALLHSPLLPAWEGRESVKSTTEHYCVSGRPVASSDMVRPPLALTAEQCRRILVHKGWSRTAVIHCAPSFPTITDIILETLMHGLDVDGIVINLVQASSTRKDITGIPSKQFAHRILNACLPIDFEIRALHELLLALTAYRNLGCNYLIVESGPLREINLDAVLDDIEYEISDGPFPGVQVIRIRAIAR